MVSIATMNQSKLEEIDRVIKGAAIVDATEGVSVRGVTLTEAAKRYGCSRPTIYRMVRNGTLKSFRLNGATRVLLSSLLDHATAKTA